MDMAYKKRIQNIDLDKLADVIKFFNSIPNEPEVNPVDMASIHAPSELSCGTPACFGGYLTHYFYSRGDIDSLDYTYSFGCQLFADLLGFGGLTNLKKFLKAYPELWGNENGFYIFSSPNAFGDMGCDTITLRDIVKQLIFFSSSVEVEQTRIKEGA